jgi:hypothetical protein
VLHAKFDLVITDLLDGSFGRDLENFGGEMCE